jgi:hypothetical protein
MNVPVGKTYLAHAVIAFIVLTGFAINAAIDFGWITLSYAEGLGMLLMAPAGLPGVVALAFAVYATIAVLVALARRRPVPRELKWMTIGFLVFVVLMVVIGVTLGDQSVSTRIAAVPVVGYVILTFTIGTRYVVHRRRSPER